MACLWKYSIRLAFIFVLLLPLHLSAQLKFKFEYYSTENGLSHDAVTNIMKDREGFLWIGTWNGINRFDGHNFKSYKSFPGDLSKLKNDRIDQIIEDHSTNLWIKAYDNQIYRFDKRTEQFSPFLMKQEKDEGRIVFDRIQVSRDGVIWLLTIRKGLVIIPGPEKQQEYIHIRNNKTDALSLPSDTVNFVREDMNGKIWVGTSKGLACLAKLANGKYQVENLDHAIFGDENFTTFAEDKQQVCFGSDRGSLVCFDKGSKKTTRQQITSSGVNTLIASRKKGGFYASSSSGELIYIQADGKNISRVVYRNGEALFSLYEDRSGYLWVEPQKNGVLRFSPAENKFEKFSQINDGGYSYMGNHFKVFEDNKGLVWVNMKGGGFGYYNPATSKMEGFFNIPGSADQRFSNIITSLYYDPSGVLWFSTVDRGINKAIFQDDNFTQRLLTTLPHHKSDNEVRGIWTDRGQRLWLGVKSGNLYLDRNGKKIAVTFMNPPKGGIGQVYCILGDSKGYIWLGTKANGLFRARALDKQQTRYELSHFSKGRKGSAGINSNEIYSLLEDRHGKIWIGTFDEGLNVAVNEKNSIRFINKENGSLGYPQEGYKKIRNMALDKKGNIWIATTNGLVIKQAGGGQHVGERYAAYSKIPGDKKSLGNNDVQFVLRDRRNMMWLATSGGGLDRALGEDPFKGLSFRNYTTKDGLPSDYVLSCTEDKRGFIWAATQNGLTRFEPNKQEFKNYDSYDGLPKATFSEASVQKFANGILVFGTTKGYLYFHPDSIGNSQSNANMVFTGLQVNNKDQFPSTEGILQTNINYVEALDLKYNENIISIDYAVLDPKSGPKQTYAYRLSGFESQWNNNSDQRRATYTNLPPGNYVFEVKSLNKDVYHNIPYKKIRINILPPPWKSWPAYVIYTLLVMVLIAVVRRNAITMLRLRNKIAVEQQLAELKSNFFTNISHELRTPLTLILNPIEEISKNETLSEQGIGQIAIVRKNSNRMIRFINQLLDLRKLQSGKATLRVREFDLVFFLKNIFEYFNEIAIKKNITLTLICEQEHVMVWADAEKLDIVFYNLLSNAFKFSPENKSIKVILILSECNDEVTIEVCDQGQGVEEGELDEIFKLYYQANEYSDTYQKGTGIGLALSKELMELHLGSISAIRNGDKGLTIRVKLPLGKAHLNSRNIEFLQGHDDEIHTSEPSVYIPDLQENTDGLKAIAGASVLLVEDNNDLREFLAVQLAKHYNVETASDGVEGWEKAQAILPDLILSDVMMPRMGGIALLDKLKNEISTSHIPVVLLSAKFSVEDQIEGLRYGADYYIAKPFNNEFLFAAISNLIKRRKSIFGAMVEKKEYAAIEPTAIVITDRDKVFLEKIIEIVEKNMENSEFNIDAAAEIMGMARSTFYRKFKSLTNLAPVEFVRDMRIQRGKQYLDAGEKSIAVIAYTVGFNNAKYFSSCFRDKYNITPSEYIRSKS